MEDFARLIESLSSLIQAVSWPLIVLVILFMFASPLRKFLNDMGEFTFKAGASGLEATARRKQIEAAALLGAASTKAGTGTDTGKVVPDIENARQIADVVTQAGHSKLRKKLSETSILWVDDNPENNLYERRALETLGIRFTIATSTQEALEKIRSNKYDVIISDMSRPPDKIAGYTLLEEKLKLNDRTSYIIYAGASRPEQKEEARQRGAFGQTNRPQELFQFVLSALGNP